MAKVLGSNTAASGESDKAGIDELEQGLSTKALKVSVHWRGSIESTELIWELF
jgi:hypothetical protein